MGEGEELLQELAGWGGDGWQGCKKVEMEGVWRSMELVAIKGRRETGAGGRMVCTNG